MTKCSHCGVIVDSNLMKCPLCFNSLNKGKDKTFFEYPEYKSSDKSVLKFKLKVLAFIFISIICVSVLINLLTWNGYPWFLFIATSLFYIWLLIRNTIVSKSLYGTKVITQLIGLSVLIIVIDILSHGDNWSVNFVIPGFLMLSTLLVTIKIYTNKLKWGDYFIFLILLVLLGFAPLVLYLLNISSVLWPSAASALFALLTLIALSIFSHKEILNELIKRFHI